MSKIKQASSSPRRYNLSLYTPAERAIYDALQAVEMLPADIRLTQAVILLGDAHDLVCSFIDEQQAKAGN